MALPYAEEPVGDIEQESTAGYPYEPLPDDRWIRVMVLEPAESCEEPLVARLVTQNLGPHIPRPPYSEQDLNEARKADLQEYRTLVASSRLPYTALSYSWATQDGDQSLCRSLTLGDREVPVTQNLTDGLRRIRSQTEAKRLWVDAVCINERDHVERNAQVAIMGDIYKLACHCIVWLGEGPTEDHDLIIWQVFHCISPYGEADDSHFWWLTVLYRAAWELLVAVRTSHCTSRKCNGGHTSLRVSDMGATYRARARDLETTETASEIQSMTKAWLGRRYWARRWVLQENASRQDTNGMVHFHWGQYSVDRGGLQKVLCILHSINYLRDNQLLPFHIRNVVDCEIGTCSDLCDLFDRHSEMQCVDARDRLYCLFPLIAKSDLQADYTISIRELCIKFAKLLVLSHEVYIGIQLKHCVLFSIDRVPVAFYNCNTAFEIISAAFRSSESPTR